MFIFQHLLRKVVKLDEGVERGSPKLAPGGERERKAGAAYFLSQSPFLWCLVFCPPAWPDSPSAPTVVLRCNQLSGRKLTLSYLLLSQTSGINHGSRMLVAWMTQQHVSWQLFASSPCRRGSWETSHGQNFSFINVSPYSVSVDGGCSPVGSHALAITAAAQRPN